jgi:hypothetical protein
MGLTSLIKKITGGKSKTKGQEPLQDDLRDHIHDDLPSGEQDQLQEHDFNAKLDPEAFANHNALPDMKRIAKEAFDLMNAAQCGVDTTDLDSLRKRVNIPLLLEKFTELNGLARGTPLAPATSRMLALPGAVQKLKRINLGIRDRMNFNAYARRDKAAEHLQWSQDHWKSDKKLSKLGGALTYPVNYLRAATAVGLSEPTSKSGRVRPLNVRRARKLIKARDHSNELSNQAVEPLKAFLPVAKQIDGVLKTNLENGLVTLISEAAGSVRTKSDRDLGSNVEGSRIQQWRKSSEDGGGQDDEGGGDEGEEN